jgi:hypothetical protein
MQAERVGVLREARAGGGFDYPAEYASMKAGAGWRSASRRLERFAEGFEPGMV